MRRDLRIVAVTMLLGAGWLAVEHGRVALADMSTFRVRDVEVRGARFIERDQVVTLLRLEPETSVWTDPIVWIERLERHPLILEADVSRRLPGGLVVTIRERRPVALAPAPALQPLDEHGVWLPVDPATYRLDLPIIASDRQRAPNARYAPGPVRALAAEVGRLMSADTAFLQRVSELSWEEDRSLRVRWTDPPVDFIMPPSTPVGRLREGLHALADAGARDPRNPPDEIDLRFADQVVVRRTPEQ